MTQEEIIAMAREADVSFRGDWDEMALVAFAKLVAAKAEAKERDACATIYAQLFTDPENQPTQHGTVTVEFMNCEIANEREACAKECEHTALRMGSEWMAQHCAEAIRARGQQ